MFDISENHKYIGQYNKMLTYVLTFLLILYGLFVKLFRWLTEARVAADSVRVQDFKITTHGKQVVIWKNRYQQHTTYTIVGYIQMTNMSGFYHVNNTPSIKQNHWRWKYHAHALYCVLYACCEQSRKFNDNNTLIS